MGIWNLAAIAISGLGKRGATAGEVGRFSAQWGWFSKGFLSGLLSCGCEVIGMYQDCWSWLGFVEYECFLSHIGFIIPQDLRMKYRHLLVVSWTVKGREVWLTFASWFRTDEWLKPIRGCCRCWGCVCQVQVMIWDLFGIQHQWNLKVLEGSSTYFKVPSSWLVFHEVGLELNPRCQQIVDIASPILRCRFVDVHIFRNNHELTIMNMINSNHLKSAPLPPKSGTCRCTRIFGASTQLLGGLVKL